MSHTASRLDCDTSYGDVKLVVSPEDIMFSGTTATARNAAADWSINQGASQAVIYGFSLSKIMERFGLAMLLQEQFGTAAGVAGPSGVAGTSDPLALPAGIPPYLASQLPARGVRSGNIAKGFQLTDVTLEYLITGAALTLHTIRVDKVVYANNVALAITSVLANAANGLATATQANPYLTKVATPNGVFNTTDNSDIFVEIAATTQVAGAYRLYRAFLHGNYNLN